MLWGAWHLSLSGYSEKLFAKRAKWAVSGDSRLARQWWLSGDVCRYVSGQGSVWDSSGAHQFILGQEARPEHGGGRDKAWFPDLVSVGVDLRARGRGALCGGLKGWGGV